MLNTCLRDVLSHVSGETLVHYVLNVYVGIPKQQDWGMIRDDPGIGLSQALVNVSAREVCSDVDV